jgi:hypothetical protein
MFALYLSNINCQMNAIRDMKPTHQASNNIGSYSELHQCTFPIFKKNHQKSHISEIQRDQQRVNYQKNTHASTSPSFPDELE